MTPKHVAMEFRTSGIRRRFFEERELIQLAEDVLALHELVEVLPRCDHEDCAGPDDGTLGAKGKVATHVDEDDMWHYCDEHVPDREAGTVTRVIVILADRSRHEVELPSFFAEALQFSVPRKVVTNGNGLFAEEEPNHERASEEAVPQGTGDVVEHVPAANPTIGRVHACGVGFA